MTTPSADAQATVQAVQDNAQRLGLTWTRRPATVTSTSPLMATLDGDTEPISMTSMLERLEVGQRVYVDIVPPSANFIVGIITVATPIGAHVARALSVQSLPNGAATVVIWDLELFDTSGFLGATPTANVVIPADLGGIYTMTASVEMTGTGTRNFATILINGVRFVRSSLDPGEDFIGVSGTRTLGPGDIITVDAFQNSGVGVGMIVELWLFRVLPAMT
jgi:hypothetical protein